MASHDIDLLTHSLDFLLENSCLHPEWGFRELLDMLSFDRKRRWLQRRIEEDKRDTERVSGLVLSVDRQTLMQQSCAGLLATGADTLKGRFQVRFVDEEGVGAGVRREWFREISREMFNPGAFLSFPFSPLSVCVFLT